LSDAPITFLVPGYPSGGEARGATGSRPSDEARRGTLKQSVTVAARRGEGGEVTVTAVPGRDVVVLHIQDGPSLTLHPANARDLILAQSGFAPNRGGSTADGVRVPASFRWRGIEQTVPSRGASRSRLGDVILKGIDVFKDAVADVLVDKAQSFAASELVRRVDAQVTEGVYALNQAELTPLKTGTPLARIEGDPEKLLVLIHGTFSTTSGTFGRLWTKHPARVQELFESYSKQVYALDHRTLGASPLSNALTLARALPEGAHVHLVTHSRGGLVGEVLARACATGSEGQEFFNGDGYAQHRQDLKDLLDAVRTKKITVDRFVRVACPVRGTLLASRRIDAYLSVLKWTLDLAGIPVAGSVVDFLNGVAQHRTSPEEIPGLAAQIPDSPVVQWLHQVGRPLESELRVVAGDVEGDSITSWLKTLLADAFYWTDNDFVVQTGSMYGGAPRQFQSTFLLNQGGKVSHFTYFDHQKTADAIVDALTQDQPQGFRPIGKESYAGRDSSGIRARVASDPRPITIPDASKPAVILVPGVFGSHLKDERGRVWLDWEAVDPLARLQYTAAGITADGLVEGLYAKLHAALSATHDVIPFPYDWRKPIEQSAIDLAVRVDDALRAREVSGQPVRLLAHSTGGLVARALQLDHVEVWQRWLAHPDARLLMLGTPNAGLWAPMQLLSGDDTLGGVLTFLSPPSRDRQTRRTLAEFPGVMQLQAGLLDQPALQDPRTWQALAGDDVRRATEASSWHASDAQKSQLAWGLPDEKTFKTLLAAAVALQQRLANQLTANFERYASKILLVTGQAPLTPFGYADGAEGFTYLYTPSGDGYVTYGSAALPGVKAWTVDDGHDGLPSKAAAFDAYIELLQKGSTARLSFASAVVGGGDTRGVMSVSRETVRMRPARIPKSLAPPGATSTLLGTSDEDRATTEDPDTLQVTIVNGDLSFVRQPVMLGHYVSSRLTGTEYVMNGLIGDAMDASLKKGLYPDRAGSHHVFVNTRPHAGPLPRPQAVIVVGLGEEGKLKPADLIATVRNGVMAWAQRLSERPDTGSTFELAATLIGSGGIDMSAGQSADLIVQGVCQANAKLSEGRDGGDQRDPARPWPQVTRLFLIEIYLSRAAEAFRALRMSSDLSSVSRRFVLTEVVETGTGGLPRPIDSEYRGVDYDFIRAETQISELGLSIAYTLDTKRRARSEVRPQPIQDALIRNLVERGADHQNRDVQIGRTLFRLLVPVELEPFLTGDTDTQLEVDRGTAGIPWELLDTTSAGSNDNRPWAIRTKLMRKLKTAEFRADVADASLEASALVIGEPLCDPKLYPRLPGAVAEANAVAETLQNALSTDYVRLLAEAKGGARPDADTVIKTLLTGSWRIVHIAGHGEPPDESGAKSHNPGIPQIPSNPRGVVLSNGVYLGSREINSMRTVPELVFVNCCYLAQRSSSELLTPEQTTCARLFGSARPSFASGLADTLIKVGVRCVIAAGWAVDDAPAKIFAVRFYEALIAGERFIDAVAQAREAAAREPNSITWGAYQCYGDPDWTLRKGDADASAATDDGLDEFSVVASPRGLLLALETIVVRIKHQNRNVARQRKHIQWLEDKFAARWGNQGSVAEGFGHAWAEAGEREAARKWYRTALAANDGGASLRSAEQLANMEVRLAWQAVAKADRQYQKEKSITPPSPTLANAKDERDRVIGDARQQVNRGIELLATLVSLERSMERESLLGSAYKRLALIEAIAHEEGTCQAEEDALKEMQKHYKQAEDFGREHKLKGFYYPALNRLASDLVLRDGSAQKLVAADVEAIRGDLDATVADFPEFWNVVSQTELRVYEALDGCGLGASLPQVIDAYNDLQRRIGHPWMWSSVYDQAQFVLSRYKKRATVPEQESADLLLRHLKTLSS